MAPSELLIRALRDAWTTLRPMGIPMAVFGGIAMGQYNRPRSTLDVDLVIGIGEQDVTTILDRLCAARMRPLRDPPVLHLDGVRLIQVAHSPNGTIADYRVDLLVADNDFLLSVLERSRPSVLPGTEDLDMKVVAPEDLGAAETQRRPRHRPRRRRGTAS